MGTEVDADATGATTAAGVWVAGNVADIRAQVISAAASGLAAGAAINNNLIFADAARALRAYRYEHFDSEDAWDQRYADIEQLWSGHPNGALVSEVAGLPPGRASMSGAARGRTPSGWPDRAGMSPRWTCRR